MYKPTHTHIYTRTHIHIKKNMVKRGGGEGSSRRKGEKSRAINRALRGKGIRLLLKEECPAMLQICIPKLMYKLYTHTYTYAHIKKRNKNCWGGVGSSKRKGKKGKE